MGAIINILHICSYYYGTKLYQNLMENLITDGIGTEVYAPCTESMEYQESPQYLIQAKCFQKIDRLFFHYKYEKVYNYLIRNIEIRKYDLTHAHSLFANGYVSYKLYKCYHVPYIVAVRNTDINVFFKYFFYLRKLGIEILKNASKVVLISNSYKNKLLKYVPKKEKKTVEEKCIVIPNGIDEYFFEAEKTKKSLKPEKLDLIYTGRIDENKNLITTIKCCDKILKNKYSIQLTVIGTITSKRYKRIMKHYNFIQYLGQKDKKEITAIYKNMDIFVMPSKHETFGLTYVEAMSQGLPVIYTRNEGFDQFFQEGEVGYSIKYNDAKEMSDKIEMIIKDYNKISKNCEEKAKLFNWRDISKKYVDIYKELTKQ